jgi:hypothetical protein
VASSWIVTIERDDEDPLIVGFDDETAARCWRNVVNSYAEAAWPAGWHNYARHPEQPHEPGPIMARILAEERQT